MLFLAGRRTVSENWLDGQGIRVVLAADAATFTHSAYTRAEFPRTMLDDDAYLAPREDLVLRIEQNSHFMRSPQLCGKH
jgi:hypothetical protein